jgi:hypothetical protein
MNKAYNQTDLAHISTSALINALCPPKQTNEQPLRMLETINTQLRIVDVMSAFGAMKKFQHLLSTHELAAFSIIRNECEQALARLTKNEQCKGELRAAETFVNGKRGA